MRDQAPGADRSRSRVRPRRVRRTAGAGRSIGSEDRPRRERRPHDKLTRLITSASSIFGQEGFTRARIDAVCRAAGVSVGTFYDHFENKADLILHVAELAFESARPPVANSLSGMEDQVGALIASPTAGIARAWLEAISVEPELRRAHARMRVGHLAGYTSWVRDARARRSVSASLGDESTARAVIALLKEGVIATYEPPRDRAEHLARAIWFLLFAE